MAKQVSNNSSNLSKYLVYAIYALTVTPLIIFSEFISPFHFGKAVVFRIIIELAAVLYILLIWREPYYRPKSSFILWSFFSFAVAFSVTTLTSIIPYASLWGSLERMGGVITFWHYFIYFLILTSVVRKREDWMRLFNVMIVMGLLSAFYGFLQRTDASFIIGSGGRARIFGTLGNAALFAGYQVLILFLSLMLFFRKGVTYNQKVFYGVSVAITTLAVAMTAVRGSILAVGVGFLVFAMLYSAAYKSHFARKALLGLVTLVILFVTVALMIKNTDFVKRSGYLSRITDLSFTSYTVQTRFWAWEAGFKGWKETPKTMLLGWGPENFNIPFAKYFNPKFFRGPGSETLFDRAHNMFVEITVTMGLLGLLTYLTIFGSSFRVAWRKLTQGEDRIYGVGIVTLLIAYAIHNSFIFDTSANFYTFFTILGFIYFLDREEEITSTKPAPSKINYALWSSVGLVMAIVAIVMAYRVNIIPSIANYTTTRAILISWEGKFQPAVDKFKEAISYDTHGKYEHRNRFAQYVLETTNAKTLTPEYEKAILEALDAVQKNIDENKPDYLPYLYASRLYITLGKTSPNSEYNDRALEISQQALELSPTFVRTYYEIGQAYLNKGDKEKAIEAFKKALALNPEVGISAWYWGIVEIDRGNIDEGLRIIEDIIFTGKYQPTESDYNRLINIYLSRKEYRKLEVIYQGLLKSKPNSAQYHASYAVVLAQLGKIDSAVAAAKKAAELDKSFEAEARAFVQALGRQW